MDKNKIFGPLMKWGPAPKPQPVRAVITDPLYRRMVANPNQKIPFTLTERALTGR
jgi:hypothetical protein